MACFDDLTLPCFFLLCAKHNQIKFKKQNMVLSTNNAMKMTACLNPFLQKSLHVQKSPEIYP